MARVTPQAAAQEQAAQQAAEDPEATRTRPARRLYVGNLPPGTGQDAIQSAIEAAVTKAYQPVPGGAVTEVFCAADKPFAFVTFRSVELATACLALDGLAINGKAVRVNRPKDYDPAQFPPVPGREIKLNTAALGLVQTQVPDGPRKIFIGGLPHHLKDDQVRQLLSSQGPLAALNVVRDPHT